MLTKEVANRWRYTNQTETSNAKYATTNGNTGFTRDTWFPQKYFFDGSYINFKNITAGYNFKVKTVGMRLYVSGQNVFLITKYPAGNPEVSSNGNSARQPSIDNVAVPLPVTYTVGVNMKF